MISTFANKNITIFPQTVYYNLEEESGRKILQDAIEVYDKCKNMKMLFRDQTSYEFAKKHFESKYTKVYLSPDIALYYKCNDALVNRKGIRLCLRGDREKDSNLNVIEWTKRFATNKKIPCYMTDTVQNHSIPIWLRQKKIDQKIAEFNRSEVVITDRLHGMIFAAISNTKCIAFDNLTHKVSGVYNLWLKDNPNTILLDNSCDEKDFLSLLVSIMEESSPNELWKDGLRYSFIKMMKDIESEE